MSHPNTRIVNLKGENGSVLIADTLTHVGPFDTILVLAAAVLNLTGGNMQGVVTGVSVPAGSTVYGVFPNLTLVSGTVIAYYKNPQINVAPAPVQAIGEVTPQKPQAPV